VTSMEWRIPRQHGTGKASRGKKSPRMVIHNHRRKVARILEFGDERR
jgi:hypothetical protein